MDQLIEFISQKCVWIPATVLPVLITVVVVIYKIFKISTSNSVMNLKLALANKKIKMLDDNIDVLIEQREKDLQEEKEYLMAQNEVEFNRKKIALNNQRIVDIDSKLKSNKEFTEKRIEDKKHENEVDAKTKKVRVKVVKKAVEETLAEQVKVAE